MDVELQIDRYKEKRLPVTGILPFKVWDSLEAPSLESRLAHFFQSANCQGGASPPGTIDMFTVMVQCVIPPCVMFQSVTLFSAAPLRVLGQGVFLGHSNLLIS